MVTTYMKHTRSRKCNFLRQLLLLQHKLWSQILGSFKASFFLNQFSVLKLSFRHLFTFLYTQLIILMQKTGIWYLYICVFGILLLFSCFAPYHLSTFLIFQLSFSLLFTTKELESEFSAMLQLTKMCGKFQHATFCVDKLSNFQQTDFITCFMFSANKLYLHFLADLKSFCKWKTKSQEQFYHSKVWKV